MSYNLVSTWYFRSEIYCTYESENSPSVKIIQRDSLIIGIEIIENEHIIKAPVKDGIIQFFVSKSDNQFSEELYRLRYEPENKLQNLLHSLGLTKRKK